MEYSEFLERKSQAASNVGFEPVYMPDFLYDFQKALVEWAVRKGRTAVFADCGLGKTPMQLAWSENVVRKTNGKVLILTPLAVSYQTAREAEKFGIEAAVSRDGKSAPNITIANYEMLAHFSPDDFAGIVCDESGILKNYSGATRNAIIDFSKTLRYRLLATATPSPNDYTELGNSAEALGVMRRVETLGMYFIHDGGDTQGWRLKGHAKHPFWAFVASWARAVRKPSDLGFADGKYILPPLRNHKHILPSKAMEGYLFPITAITLDEQRRERRETIESRCGKVAEIANSNSDPFIAWCSLNAEGEMLTKMIGGAVEVSGSLRDEEKEERLLAFSRGEIRALVSKPSICGHGMNWQHCASMSVFPSHSHEQYYQIVRRCWRFGQTRPVDVHVVTTESESAVVENLERKERESAELFAQIVANMSEFYTSNNGRYHAEKKASVPSWLTA